MPLPLTRIVSELHRLAEPPASDADLLGRFVARRDERAFETLVERHGSMVMRLCRRILGDVHAAEDAYQATFLVLSRKAATLRQPAALAGWLYGVAQRIALKSRRSRRCLPAVAEALDPNPDPLSILSARELLVALEEELTRLPQSYRMAVVLCCLEGLSRDEAAARLGCTLGALRGHLERGRQRLHTRLVKRGVTLTAALAAAEVVHGTVAAATVTGNAASGEALRLAAEALRGGALLKVPLVLLTFVCGAGALWLLAGGVPAHEQPQQQAPQPAVADKAAPVDRDAEPLPSEAIARIGSTRLRHPSSVVSVAYTPNRRSIASLDEDGHLWIWNAATGASQRRWRPAKYTHNGAFAFHADGKRLMLFDGFFAKTLDAASSKTLQSIRQESAGVAFRAHFDRTGKLLALADDLNLRLVDMEAGKEILRTPVEVGGELIHDAVPSPDGKQVAVSIANGGRVLLLDAATGKVNRVLDGPDGSALRGLEALEQIARPEALRLLDDLAQGDPAARLTREAAVARERLRRLAKR